MPFTEFLLADPSGMVSCHCAAVCLAVEVCLRATFAVVLVGEQIVNYNSA